MSQAMDIFPWVSHCDLKLAHIKDKEIFFLIQYVLKMDIFFRV